MVIIDTNYHGLVDATCQVSYKSPNRRFGPVVLEIILKGSYNIWAWRSSWSCAQHHAIKFYIPRLKKLA